MDCWQNYDLCFRAVINDVQQKANIIQGSGGQQQGGGGGGVVQLTLHELKDNLNNARNDIAMLLTRPQVGAHEMSWWHNAWFFY